MSDFAKKRTEMVDCQVRPSDVTKFSIINAMLEIPREDFVPPNRRELAYVGEHVQLTKDRVLLDPRVLAKMLNALDIRSEDLVLDVGSGLGYSSAIIARMAEAVVALEENEGFSKESESLLARHSVDNVIAITGNLVEGASRLGPYDAITVQGGIEVLPDALLQQLKEHGRIAAIFSGGTIGQCRIGVKNNNRITWRTAFDAFAPVLSDFKKVKEFEF